MGVGESVTGSLDYIFDFDFFRFQAEEGRKYRFSVEHDTLKHSSINLYGPNALNDERERWQGRDNGPDGPLLLWQAPSSEVYYFAVQDFGGETGDYTLRITPLETVETEDDHGDGPGSATEISIGGKVSGIIDNEFDHDIFSFSAREGDLYLFEFFRGSFNILCADVLLKDDTVDADWNNDCDEFVRSNYSETYGIQWGAPETGTYYLDLYGYAARVGEYEFEISRYQGT